MESESIPPPLDWSSLVLTTIILLLLLFSALISGSEVAFFALKEKPEDSKIKENNPLIFNLLKKPQQLLATILIANNFVNIAIVVLTSYLIDPWLKNMNQTFAFLLKIVGITAIILFFGEILPKVLATRNDLKFAKFTAPFIAFINKTFAPMALPMARISERLAKHLRNENLSFSREDLSHMLQMTKNQATTDEQRLLSGVVSFGNTEAREIMKPRLDIFALEDTETFPEVIKKVLKKGYSRIPVYHENPDNIIGILLAKDLLGHLNDPDFNWKKLLRKPFFVPENMKLDDLLREFQKKRMHLAIVVDEYGGTSGLITLEDVMEEVLGEEIRDEYDKEKLPYKKINANTYLFDGKTPLKDFYKYMQLPPEQTEAMEQKKGPSESLAGFFLELNGHFPKINDKIRFHNLEFTIKDIDRNRINKIQVVKK